METALEMKIYNWKLFSRDVRRDVRNCVLLLFLFFLLNIIIILVMSAGTISSELFSDPDFLDKLASSDGQEITEAITDIADDSIGLMSIVAVVVSSLVFFILRKKRFITDLAAPMTEPLTPRIFIILLLATQAIQLVYSLLIMLVDNLLPEGLSLSESYGAAMDELMTPTGLLYIILIGPIFEELIFRGAILGNLRRFGDNFAIIFSSLLFGFYHGIFLQIPFAFIVGLLFGYVAVRWSLRVSIVLHIAVNGLSTLVSDTGNEDLATAGGLAMIACTVLTVIFAIKWRKILKARMHSGAAYYKRTYRYGFSSVAFWIFILIMTGVGLMQLNTTPIL